MKKRLFIALSIAIALSLIFMFWPLKNGYNALILQIRFEKLSAIFLLAICGGVSTLIFQTLTANRLLTPQLMGIDSIYRLFHASLILFVGERLYQLMPASSKFIAITLLSMTIATFFFIFVLQKLRGDVFRLLLIGVIFSVFCRSLSEFISRLLDPQAYAVLQSVSFAQLSQINLNLLFISSILCAITLALLWHKRHVFDIIALGKNTSISLGIAYLPYLIFGMMSVSLLVSIATALVGPMLFFGLLACALTYTLFPTPYHQTLIPAVSLVAFIILLSGEILFERVLHLAGTLSIAVEFVGGILFILLIYKRKTI